VIPETAGFCGVCGVSLEALTREKKVSWSKLHFLNVEGLKQTPLTPQTPQPAIQRPFSRARKGQWRHAQNGGARV
jgi:hypothetical protein